MFYSFYFEFAFDFFHLINSACTIGPQVLVHYERWKCSKTMGLKVIYITLQSSRTVPLTIYVPTHMYLILYLPIFPLSNVTIQKHAWLCRYMSYHKSLVFCHKSFYLHGGFMKQYTTFHSNGVSRFAVRPCFNTTAFFLLHNFLILECFIGGSLQERNVYNLR